MIPFFRKIRKKMANDNKPIKYLRYAIGEIMLVVIGILLALQINQWNQNRINHNTEKEYYQRFLDDVFLEELIINQQIVATKERLLSSSKLLSLLQRKNSGLKQIANAIRNSVARADFTIKPTKHTYEDIKSSGNLKLIKDYELKNKLDRYYSNLEGLMNNVNINAARLALRMLNKDDLIGTGFANTAIFQNGIDSTIVDIKKLKKRVFLTQENSIKLMNDAIFYAGLNSRNLEHLKVLMKEITEMKRLLEIKCNTD